MKILSHAEAEAVCGGQAPAINIAPTINVNTNLASALQANTGVNTIAGLVDGAATIALLQGNGLGIGQYNI